MNPLTRHCVAVRLERVPASPGFERVAAVADDAMLAVLACDKVYSPRYTDACLDGDLDAMVTDFVNAWPS